MIFDRENSPVAAALMKMFVINRSSWYSKRLLSWFTEFQIPENVTSLSLLQEKYFMGLNGISGKKRRLNEKL